MARHIYKQLIDLAKDNDDGGSDYNYSQQQQQVTHHVVVVVQQQLQQSPLPRFFQAPFSSLSLVII